MIPIARGEGVWLHGLRRPALPRRHQLVVGQPVRPRQPAHQRRGRGAARPAGARDAGRVHARARGRACRAAGRDRAAGAEPLLLRRQRLQRDRSGAQDELPLLAQLRAQPRKRRFVTLSNSYHGETLGALAVGHVELYREIYQPLLMDVITVPSPDCYEREPARTGRPHTPAHVRGHGGDAGRGMPTRCAR